jgi:hypothetical protein
MGLGTMGVGWARTRTNPAQISSSQFRPSFPDIRLLRRTSGYLLLLLPSCCASGPTLTLGLNLTDAEAWWMSSGFGRDCFQAPRSKQVDHGIDYPLRGIRARIAEDADSPFRDCHGVLVKCPLPSRKTDYARRMHG